MIGVGWEGDISVVVVVAGGDGEIVGDRRTGGFREEGSAKMSSTGVKPLLSMYVRRARTSALSSSFESRSFFCFCAKQKKREKEKSEESERRENGQRAEIDAKKSAERRAE